MLSRHSMTLLLLLLSTSLVSCGGKDDGLGYEDGLTEEPPTPPPLEGVDATHLVASFPQVPVKEGEFWVRPGSVSNIVKKQQPELEAKTEPAEVEVAGAESATTRESRERSEKPAEERPVVTDGRDAANEQLVAEHTAPSPPPPTISPPRRAQKEAAPSQATMRDRVTRAAPPTPTGSSTDRPPVVERKATAPDSKATAPRSAPSTATAPTEPAKSDVPSNNLSVAKAALATKIENRQPIGISDSFAEGTRVYLFNTILNPGGKGILVHHKWYRGEERVTSIKLSIKAARWRTWSVIPVYGKGPWRVDIVEPSGRVIHTEKFTVN